MSNVNKIRYRTVKVPPEGGYGFVIMLGVAIPLVIFSLSSEQIRS